MITILNERKEESITGIKALIDCGAQGQFIDQNFVRKHRLKEVPLERKIKVFNVDGTKNKKGTIRHKVILTFRSKGREFKEEFLVTGLGRQDIILGHPWLKTYNPIVNWRTGKITWRYPRSYAIRHQIPTEGRSWIQTKITMSQTLAQEQEKPKKTLQEMVPKEYHEYLEIFDKKTSDRLPEHKPWDHKIDLKEGFIPKSHKIYPLTQTEEEHTRKFVSENLEKGYIHQSKSEMASSFFFVAKTNGDLRPCQDYRYLNEWTVKNAYPLPLIGDLMDKRVVPTTYMIYTTKCTTSRGHVF